MKLLSSLKRLAARVSLGRQPLRGNFHLSAVRARRNFFEPLEERHLLAGLQLDFSGVFNQDAVRNRPEGVEDAVDVSLDDAGNRLVTDAFASNQSANGNGLRADGFFPANDFHPPMQLGYGNHDDGNNVVLLPNSGDSAMVDVPSGLVTGLHVIAFSTDGETDMQVMLTYADGTETLSTHVADWLGVVLGGSVDSDAVRYNLIADMDRHDGNELHETNDVAVFGHRFDVDPHRRLLSFTISNTNTAPSAANLVVLGATTADATIKLGALNGNDGFRIDGVGLGDGFGGSVSNAGDVNGDGYDDVIIGANGADPHGKDHAGRSYVIFGKPGGFSSEFELTSLDGANGFRIEGIGADDQSGGSVSGAGDVNGDGLGDLIIGAHFANPTGEQQAGESYVVFGKSVGFSSTLVLAALDGTDGFRIDGTAAGDQSGRSVSGAGDVNGDGFDDLVIGAIRADPGGITDTGASYVVFGKSGDFSSTLNLSTLGADDGFRIDGIKAGDFSGISVSNAGDVNGDGFHDLIIGAYGADRGSNIYAGQSYVVFGKPSGFSMALDLAILDGTNGFRIDGINRLDSLGRSVSNAGDFNADGYDDLILGAFLANSGGASYVVFGKNEGFSSTIDLAALNVDDGFRIDGIDLGDDSGVSVGGAGDVNGDGFDDVIIGAPEADPGGAQRAGESYVVFGRTGDFSTALDLSTLNGANGFRIDGKDALGKSGISVSTAGDVNGDGFDDVIIGAPTANHFICCPTGTSYVVFGGDFTSSASHMGTGSADALFGDQMANVIIGGRDDDTLIGNGGADILRGGQGDDILAVSDTSFVKLVGGSGTDTLRLDGSGITFDLTSIADNRIVDIEMIDINGNGSNTLILDALEVLNLSSHGNKLTVLGDGDDLLELAGLEWRDEGTILLGGVDFRVFKMGQATIQVQQEVVIQLGIIKLSSLDGVNGFRVDGIDANGNSGFSVSGAGDVNGDGFDDLIIGSPNADPGSASGKGESYVVLGKAGSFSPTLDPTTLDGSNGFRLQGVDRFDASGASVSSAGDVNSDGFDDLIIGADHASRVSTGNIAGESYVVFGKTDGFSPALDLATLDGNDGFRINGNASFDRSGGSVSGAGDVNGDGFADLIIGARRASPNGARYAGESYVVFGKVSGFPTPLDPTMLNGSNGFLIVGADAGDQSGSSVSGAGDVNGDGFDDLIIGARTASAGSEFKAGASYVVFGKAGGFASTLDLATLDGSNGFRFDGIDSIDYSGSSVSDAGDVNGDGFDDLIIGAFHVDFGGASYVVFGRGGGFSSVLDASSLDGVSGFRIEGISAGDYSGFAVSAAGDVNGDGFDDLVIGATRAAERAGQSYVVYGKAAGLGSALLLETLDGANGFRIDGIDTKDESGFAVSGAGDVNGDGFDDLIIGAIWADPGGDQNAGQSYVLFGGDLTSSVTHSGSGVADRLVGDAAANVIIGGPGDDTLIGNGGADVLRGGQGGDILTVSDAGFARAVGGNGTDTLRLQASGVTLDLTQIADNRIVDIETVDITGGAFNTLILDAREVLNISTTNNTLLVRHGSDAVVNFGEGFSLDQPIIVNNEFRHVFRHNSSIATIEAVNDITWQNPLNRFDVNVDGMFFPNDILVVINTLNRDGPRRLISATSVEQLFANYYDVNGDGFVTPQDALVAINHFIRLSPAPEGEASLAKTSQDVLPISNHSGSSGMFPPSNASRGTTSIDSITTTNDLSTASTNVRNRAARGVFPWSTKPQRENLLAVKKQAHDRFFADLEKGLGPPLDRSTEVVSSDDWLAQFVSGSPRDLASAH